MKTMKKIMAVLLAAIMVLAMTTTAFAADPTGKITLTNASIGKDYSVYKLLDATYNTTTENTAYSTKDTAVAAAFAGAEDTEEEEIFVVGETPDSEGNYSVSVAEGKTDAALAWIKANAETYGTLVTDSKKTAASTTLEWTLPYGYYYITSGLGAVLTIDSNTPSVSVIDKNTTKPVTPDPDPNDPTKAGAKSVAESSAKIGDTVHFTVNLTATNFVTETPEGGEAATKQITKYVITDTPEDVTLNSDIKVMVGTTELTSAAKAFNTDGKLELAWVDGDGKSIYASPVDVTITYTGIMTKAAVDGDATNDAKVAYFTSDAPTTPVVVNPDDEPVVIETYEFSLSKVDKEDPTKKLEGAEFHLYDAATAGNEIKVVACKADGTIAGASDTVAYYRVAEAGETAVVIVAGDAIVKGLAAGTYYLDETKAPLGYNVPQERIEVSVEKGTNSITVENTTGIELPSTGGEGTTILIICGSILFVAAAIVLVTKKRMYNQG